MSTSRSTTSQLFEGHTGQLYQVPLLALAVFIAAIMSSKNWGNLVKDKSYTPDSKELSIS